MIIKQYIDNTLIVANLCKSKHITIENDNSICTVEFKTEDFDSIYDHFETMTATALELERHGYKVKKLFGRNLVGELIVIKLKIY